MSVEVEPWALDLASRLSLQGIYNLAISWDPLRGSSPSSAMTAEEFELLAAARELLYVALSVVEPAAENAHVVGDDRR